MLGRCILLRFITSWISSCRLLRVLVIKKSTILITVCSKVVADHLIVQMGKMLCWPSCPWRAKFMSILKRTQDLTLDGRDWSFNRIGITFWLAGWLKFFSHGRQDNRFKIFFFWYGLSAHHYLRCHTEGGWPSAMLQICLQNRSPLGVVKGLSFMTTCTGKMGSSSTSEEIRRSLQKIVWYILLSYNYNNSVLFQYFAMLARSYKSHLPELFYG